MLSGFELYPRWVPLKKINDLHLAHNSPVEYWGK